MHRLRGNFGERDQNEGALVQTRVRQGQLGRVEDHVVDQEQIEIDRARSVREGARATQVALDAEQCVEEVDRSQRGLQRNDRVQESRLLQVSDRLRLVETRDSRRRAPKISSRWTAVRSVAIRSPRFDPSPM